MVILVAPPVPAAAPEPSGKWVGCSTRGRTAVATATATLAVAPSWTSKINPKGPKQGTHTSPNFYLRLNFPIGGRYKDRPDDKKNSPEIRPTRSKERALKGPG